MIAVLLGKSLDESMCDRGKVRVSDALTGDSIVVMPSVGNGLTETDVCIISEILIL
jgi:hypothetical protein